MKYCCNTSKLFLIKPGNLLLLLLMLLMSDGFSQFSFYKNYTTNDGLPSSKIYDMLQDNKGYMWFATENGVSRFDGYEFRNFTTRDGLPANSTLKLYEDFMGRIWFLSFQGPLSYFYNDKITPFEFNDELIRLAKSKFFDNIYIDSTETIWLSPNDNGLYRISSKGGIFEEHSRQRPEGANIFSLFYFTENNQLLTWTQSIGIKSNHSKLLIDKGIESIEFDQNSSQTYYQNSECKLGDNDYLLSLALYFKHIKNGKVIFETTFGNEVIAIYKDNAQNIWISEQFNCAFMYPEGKLNKEPVKFLPNTSVSKILQDTQGNYWFATTEKGVYFVPSIAFSNYGKDSLTIENDIIITMEVFEDQLFLTTDNKGIYCFLLDDNSIEKNPDFKFEGFIRSNIYDLLISSDRYLWLSDSENLMYSLSGKKTLYKPKKHIGGYSLLQLANKDILLSKSGGYSVIEMSDNKLKLTKQPFLKRTFKLFETKDSAILLGTHEGLYKYKNEKYSKYDSQNLILNNRISDIKSSNENLWIGTFDNGIVIESDTAYYYLNEENGLISNRINVIFFENEKSIWVGTNRGLSHIILMDVSTENFEVINYSIWDGLPSNEINDIIKHNDILWLGTGKGLASFNPKNISKSLTLPILNLESVFVNEKRLSQSSDSLFFPSDENNITFNYKSISFKDPGNITYQYKLKGLEEDWFETRNTSVRYPELEYGDYTFIVRAKNINNTWSDQLIYHFSIQKHYSETYLFRTLIIAGILGIIYLIFILLLRNFKNREHLIRQVLLAEQTALRAQMNPHFVFNSLNSIQDFIIKRDDKNANLYLANFSTLMRKILETSKFNTISIKEELETLRIYLELEELRFEGLFHYVITINESINLEEVFIPTMFLQTYVENAIWHGLIPKKEKGLLEIKFELLENEKFLISISDNGIGRVKAAEIGKKRKNHHSIGMKNSEERIQLINRLNKTNITVEVIDLYNNDNSAAGTRIETIFDV